MSTPTLAEIIHSVKPAQRTDRFQLLAALYALGAHHKPLAISALREPLELAVGKAKIPRYISSTLKDYPADFEVAAKGPPVLWRPSARGLLRLKSSASIELPIDAEDSYLTDVGVVCALETPELLAVEKAATESTWNEIVDPGTPLRFRQGLLRTAQGASLRLVATSSILMGLTSAAIATTQLVLRFKPRLVIMVGIAAGTKNGGKQFGDVLVADPSLDYNSGKVVYENGIRGFQPDPYPIGINPRLRSVLQKYLGHNKPVFSQIRAAWTGSIPPEGNRLHIGPVGAADQVIDDPSRILEIQAHWRKLIGVEMETYAVYRACNDAPEPKPRFVSFKAVCDFAANKTDSWQEYAAYTAAEFAIRFLRAEWSNIWPTKGASNG